LNEFVVLPNPSDLVGVGIVSESLGLLTTDNVCCRLLEKEKVMTRDELAKILETFACCVLSTAQSDLSVDAQHELITFGIDNIADTVMLFVERPVPTPSAN
jgi:hypothetical protein